MGVDRARSSPTSSSCIAPTKSSPHPRAVTASCMQGAELDRTRTCSLAVSGLLYYHGVARMKRYTTCFSEHSSATIVWVTTADARERTCIHSMARMCLMTIPTVERWPLGGVILARSWTSQSIPRWDQGLSCTVSLPQRKLRYSSFETGGTQITPSNNPRFSASFPASKD